MLTTYLAQLFARDLAALRREVEAYPDEASLWASAPSVPNCAGTLVLHLSGNLQHFVGAVLGGSGYVRDREAEFSRRHVPRAELLRAIDDAAAAVAATVPRLSAETLAEPFPIPVGPVRLVTLDFLLHLATHLTYHLGQIDYHRRALVGAAGGASCVSPGELASATRTA
ncbi:MAG: DinB family protein [Gemmatimonadaceae bacterium]